MRSTTDESSWRRYDDCLFPVFHERFEEQWGKGTAPFLDPSVIDEQQPRPRAQWVNIDTGAALAVVPVWQDDPTNRSFAILYLPPVGGIWPLRPNPPIYLDTGADGVEKDAREDAFREAVAHAERFIYGTTNEV
ncbi:hypothetical protein GCM10022261_10510 [Brevibacterium daeguense]|uniref:Uncharacterized protein n=2 Tax=Brevibacterium daeguense TaxID=909936 RepID=A0ABP8EHS0_9MICO|nr:hypothetical protein [Brevibacterium daeguense]